MMTNRELFCQVFTRNEDQIGILQSNSQLLTGNVSTPYVSTRGVFFLRIATFSPIIVFTINFVKNCGNCNLE